LELEDEFLEKKSMKILLDSNILVYAYDKLSVNHEQAKNIMGKAFGGEIEAYLSPQILYEFFAVVTNPKKAASPMNSDDAAELCLDLWGCSEIEKVNPTSSATSQVFGFVKKKKLSSAKIFDCILAVTAIENKIDVIYTENVRDFKDYDSIKVVNPLK
jgi:predicted nucleic acid-binding protein